MIKELNNKYAEIESDPMGNLIDAEIETLFGKRVEIQDGIVKCWDKACRPDETNWNPSTRYSENVDAVMSLLKECKAQYAVNKDGEGYYIEITLNEKVIVTPHAQTIGQALALGLIGLLWVQKNELYK